MEKERDVVSLKEAQTVYGMARSTLDRWIAEGRLTPVKFPRDRLTYVRREDLERLLAESKESPPGRGRPGHWRKSTEEETHA